MKFHIFHKWVPKIAFPATDGYECIVCGDRYIRKDRTYTLMAVRQQYYDWLNKEEPTQ